jgi:hypothetical protein
MSLPKNSNQSMNSFFDGLGDDFFEETLGEDWDLDAEERQIAERLGTCASCGAQLDPDTSMLLGIALAEGQAPQDADEVEILLPNGKKVRAVILDERSAGIIAACSESCIRDLRDNMENAPPTGGDPS